VTRGSRPGARKLALLAAILGVAGGIALGIIGCVQGVGDADKYGRVPLPGDGVVDLPEGEVALYYEERVTLSENDALDSPDGIRAVAVRENTRVKSERRKVGNAISLDGRALDEWGWFDIPKAGKYRVTVRSKESGSNQPAVTMGVSQTDNFVDAGLTVLFFSLGGFGVALVALLLGRIGYEPPKPWIPAATPQPTPGPAPWGAPPGTPGAPAPGAGATPWGAPPGAPGTGSAAPATTAAGEGAAPTPGSPVGGGLPGAAAPWGGPPGAPPGSAPGAPPGSAPGVPPSSPSGDPVEAQLRDLERRHQAGEIDGDEYQRRRRAVLDAAFGPPGA
jgi:hypothetical protein